MPLTESTRQKIRLAWEAQREPKRGESGSVTLRFGGGGLTYLVRQGKKTESGLFYEQLSNTELGETWDPNQIPTKRGRTDYIQTSSGERAVRTWLPTTSTYKYSKLGRSFYNRRKTEVLIHLPVIIQGVRGNGTSYEIRGTMPVSALGVQNVFVNQALSEADKLRTIKSETLKQFASHRYDNGKLVVYEVSSEIY